MKNLNTSKKPKLTLLGAGPGDPDLITVKGVTAIAKADVILYDALIGKELLDYARPGTKLISVGKTAGNHKYSQDEINHLIVAYALSHGHVLRLKGGDPFVFGRGQEELEFAKSFGVSVEIIPGISSSYALLSSLGIPLTSRGKSESFWVLTGTTKNGELSEDLKRAVHSKATIVVLMGLNKIKEIVALFETAGKHNLPAMVIQNGSTKDQKVVSGKVFEIAAKFHLERVTGPGILVFGKVLDLYNDPKTDDNPDIKSLLNLINPLSHE